MMVMTGSRTLIIRREVAPTTLRSAVVRFVWAVLLGVAGVLGLAGAAAADPGDGPWDVAVSPDGLFAYVANRGSDTVSQTVIPQ